MFMSPRCLLAASKRRARRGLWITNLDGAPAIEFTLRFTFSHPDLDTTIVGTANPAHLQANLAALAKGPLPADVYAEAARRLDAAAAE